MNSLPDAADRLITDRLSALRSQLEDSNHSTEEIDVLLAGLREHMFTEISEGDMHSLADVEHRLAEIIDDFSQDIPPSVNADTHQHLGSAALVSVIGVVIILIFGSLLASSFGADGGTVMLLTAIFGLPISFVLSWMSRKSQAGRAALMIAAITSVLFVGLIGSAYVAALFE